MLSNPSGLPSTSPSVESVSDIDSDQCRLNIEHELSLTVNTRAVWRVGHRVRRSHTCCSMGCTCVRVDVVRCCNPKCMRALTPCSNIECKVIIVDRRQPPAVAEAAESLEWGRSATNSARRGRRTLASRNRQQSGARTWRRACLLR